MNRIYAPGLRSGMLTVMSNRGDAAAWWGEIFRKQRASGLSGAAFCRRSRISQASFYAWRRKFKLRNARTTDFTEAQITPDHDPVDGLPSTQRALELVLHDGRTIVVRPGFDRATLLALVDALEHGNSDDGLAEVGAIQTVHHRQESGA